MNFIFADSWDILGQPRISQRCKVPESQVQDVLGCPGTAKDVSAVEAVNKIHLTPFSVYLWFYCQALGLVLVFLSTSYCYENL